MRKGLLRSTGIVSVMTMISRILGFIRDMVIAQLFGATAGMDAFLVAFKLPNFMRRLFAEGAFSQAFVPVFAEYKKTRVEEEVKDLADKVAGSLSLVLVIVCLLAILVAPWLIRLFAPGFHPQEYRYDLAVGMLRWTFPYLFFISLAAFTGAMLNTYQRFAIPALTPIWLNICLIAAALLLAPYLHLPITALAYGVFIAGIVQFLFQLPFLKQINLLPRPRLGFSDPGVKRILKMMVPALFGVSVAQLSLLVDTFFVSYLPIGSVTWLYYSQRLMEFPLGVFGVAIATVVMPNLATHHAGADKERFSKTLDWGLRMVLLIAIPAMLGLILLAAPLLSALLQYGKFNSNDVLMSEHSLIMYALGVPAFMLVKIFASGFYAQQDIKTPVRIAAIALASNILLNFLLIKPLAHAGLALSNSLSSIFNVGLLAYMLHKHSILQAQPGWLKFMVKLIFANFIMALVLLALKGSTHDWLSQSTSWKVMHLSYLLTAGTGSYITSLYLLGLRVRDFVARH